MSSSPKDGWDKLSSVSGFLSGIVIAAIGIFATHVYNQRQLDEQANQKGRELAVARVQTVEKFIPHLASENQAVRRAALDSIVALGDEELATKLASQFGGEASVEALADLSRSANTAVAEQASRALEDVLGSLRESVIWLSARDRDPATGAIKETQVSGFFITTDGHAIVPAYAVSYDSKVVVSLYGSDVQQKAAVVAINQTTGLAVVRIQLSDPVVPIARYGRDVVWGERVFAVGHSRGVRWLVLAGSVSAELPDGRLAADLNSDPGMAGAPVVNASGEMIGVIIGRSGAGQTFLLPSSRVKGTAVSLGLSDGAA